MFKYLKIAVSEIEKIASEQEKSMESIKEMVMGFLKDNPYPSDDAFHSYAESNGIKPDQMERAAYSLLSDFLAKGKRNKEPDKKVDPKQVEKGVKVEKEHTSNPDIATRISKDHLVEIPDYYTRLDKMETDAKKGAPPPKTAYLLSGLSTKAFLYKSAGGPGSGSGENTEYIQDRFKDLEMSPYLSIGKRGEFFKSHEPLAKKKTIKMADIKYIIQEKFVPEKIQRMKSNREVLDFPIDVMADDKGFFHVLDGHHRFLLAKSLNKHEILANIWPMPEITNKRAALEGALNPIKNMVGKGTKTTNAIASPPIGAENILPAKNLGGATSSGVKNLFQSTINK